MHPKSETDKFSVITVILAVWNNLLVAATVLLAVAVVTVLAIMYLPRSYESDAMLFIRLGRESVSLDPTANTGSTVSLVDSRDAEVNSVRDMLKNREILETVVDRVGPGVILGQAEPLRNSSQTPTQRNAETADYNGSPRQLAIKLLSEKINVFTNRKSYVLTIVCEASSPRLAQRILDEFLVAYQRVHSEAHQTPRSNSFFAQQVTVLKNQWDRAMDTLNSEKNQAGIVTLADSRENLKERENETRIQLLNIKGELDSVDNLIEQQKQILADIPEQSIVYEHETLTSTNSDEMRSILFQLEIDLREVSARFTDEHPKVAALTQQYDRVKAAYERNNLSKNQNKSATLRSKYESLKAELAQLESEFVLLNKTEVRIRELEQDVKVAESNYAQYRELQEQTRIGDALLSDQFSNVKIIQSPSFIPKPVGPKKLLIAAAGAAAGSTGAIFLCLLIELFWKKRRHPLMDSLPIPLKSDEDALPSPQTCLAAPNQMPGHSHV